MTETNRDGKISDKVLIDKGFTIGGVVVNTCRIEELAEGEHSYVIENITYTTVDMHTQADEKSKIQITRLKLITQWKKFAPKVYKEPTIYIM